MYRPVCRQEKECAFRNQRGECRILEDARFGEKSCPFRKTKQQVRHDAYVEKDEKFKKLFKHYVETCKERY